MKVKVWKFKWREPLQWTDGEMEDLCRWRDLGALPSPYLWIGRRQRYLIATWDQVQLAISKLHDRARTDAYADNRGEEDLHNLISMQFQSTLTFSRWTPALPFQSPPPRIPAGSEYTSHAEPSPPPRRCSSTRCRSCSSCSPGLPRRWRTRTGGSCRWWSRAGWREPHARRPWCFSSSLAVFSWPWWRGGMPRRGRRTLQEREWGKPKVWSRSMCTAPANLNEIQPFKNQIFQLFWLTNELIRRIFYLYWFNSKFQAFRDTENVRKFWVAPLDTWDCLSSRYTRWLAVVLSVCEASQWRNVYTVAWNRSLPSRQRFFSWMIPKWLVWIQKDGWSWTIQNVGVRVVWTYYAKLFDFLNNFKKLKWGSRICERERTKQRFCCQDTVKFTLDTVKLKGICGFCGLFIVLAQSVDCGGPSEEPKMCQTDSRIQRPLIPFQTWHPCSGRRHCRGLIWTRCYTSLGKHQGVHRTR